MALIAVSGHPGCRFEEVARFTAQRLGFELLTQSRIRALTEAEFGADAKIPDKAYASLVTSILARLATENHMVCCALGGEVQARHFLGMLRVHVVAPENVRIGNLMLDHRLDRGAARALLLELEAADRAGRKARFGKTKATAELFDMVLNAESLSSEQMAELIEAAVASAGLKERGYLSNAAEAQLQFQMRLKLARFGIVPPGSVTLRHKMFAHPSEEMFANLLDFYLAEFDLYVELTTMKQSLVTRKNRKVRLLRELYPHLNIQVFYQKDFENLIFKYGLVERPVQA